MQKLCFNHADRRSRSQLKAAGYSCSLGCLLVKFRLISLYFIFMMSFVLFSDTLCAQLLQEFLTDLFEALRMV